jgi:hypothetical protein
MLPLMLPLVPLLSALATSTPASASTANQSAGADAAPPAPVSASVPETSFMGGLGVAGGDSAGGLGFTMLATHRLTWLELGGECYGAALFSAMFAVGAVGGLHVGESFSVRALGSLGMHSYSHIGRGLLSEDPGISGSVPYAGGRLVLGYSFAGRARSAQRAFIGLIGTLDRDLDRKTKSVTYQSEDWLFGGTSEVTSTHTIGQTTVAGFLVVGVDVDLTSY